MKRFVFVLLAVLAAMPLAYTQGISEDEKALDSLVERAKKNRQKYQVEKEKPEEKVIETEKKEKDVIITTVTIKTQITTIETDDTKDTTPVNNTAIQKPAQKSTVEGFKKPISIPTFVMAQSLGILIPGSGLAHFTMGDSTGGVITLACTGLAAIMYFGAEIGVETRAIDNPSVYSGLHYGSIALFAVGYLYDIIGAPIYYFNYNNSIKTAYIKPLDIQYYAGQNLTPELNVSVLSLGLQF